MIVRSNCVCFIKSLVHVCKIPGWAGISLLFLAIRAVFPLCNRMRKAASSSQVIRLVIVRPLDDVCTRKWYRFIKR